MIQEHFANIDKVYSDFHSFLLKNGLLPIRDTRIGTWGVTPHNEAFELFRRIGLDKHSSFIDLGSGDGRIVLTAALFGLKEAKGIEYDSWLVNTALHIKRKLGRERFENAAFIEDDFVRHDIRNYDVVFVSPDKPFHRSGLEEKFRKELNGKLIVHGWEFHPCSLRRTEEHIINGEKFAVYQR